MQSGVGAGSNILTVTVGGPAVPVTVLDVAHNPEAAAVLAANLGESGYAPETIAVFGMLKDKDIAGVVRAPLAMPLSTITIDGQPAARLTVVSAP